MSRLPDSSALHFPSFYLRKLAVFSSASSERRRFPGVPRDKWHVHCCLSARSERPANKFSPHTAFLSLFLSLSSLPSFSMPLNGEKKRSKALSEFFTGEFFASVRPLSCFPLAVRPGGDAVFNALKLIPFSSLNTGFEKGREMEKSLSLVLDVFVLRGRRTHFRRLTDKSLCLNG